MQDKEKYMRLAQRYFEAETTPQEEMELARYVAQDNDPDFDELRGVLGYLSFGKGKRVRKIRTTRIYMLAAAASIAIILTIGTSLSGEKSGTDKQMCVRIAYGERSSDSDQQIMASVESSLAGFFSVDSPAETNLIEMFQR